jgi:hypothetical protein
LEAGETILAAVAVKSRLNEDLKPGVYLRTAVN